MHWFFFGLAAWMAFDARRIYLSLLEEYADPIMGKRWIKQGLWMLAGTSLLTAADIALGIWWAVL